MHRPRRAGIAISAVISALIAIGTVLAVALLPLVTSIPAQAAGTPTWRLVASRHDGPAGNAPGYSVVIAPAPDTAWAFGGTNPGGPSSPTAARWNGRQWRAVPLPAALGGFIIAASASSADNIWAVSYFGSYVLRWNGSRWTVAKKWNAGMATSVVAVSSSDVWVFSGSTSLGTLHYNGRSWTRSTGPAGAVYRASALSGSSIWAVTLHSATPVEHYSGRSWRRARTGSALARTTPDDILAVSPHNIWISGVSADGRLVIVHGNGTRWTRFVAPWQMRPERFAVDGRGGIWVPAVAGGQTWWILHLSRSGHWTRSKIGLGSGVGDLALIPRTTSLWGSGGSLTKTGGDAAIWAHGPLPGPAARAAAPRA